MALFALGLIAWVRPGWRPVVGMPVAGLLFALALSSPFTAIRAAYALPEMMPAGQLPQSAKNFDATLVDPAGGGGEIRLLGYEFGKARVHVGEDLAVKLYWQAVKPPSENYSLYIKVFGRDAAHLHVAAGPDRRRHILRAAEEAATCTRGGDCPCRPVQFE
jgi:hypothetical protein